MMIGTSMAVASLMVADLPRIKHELPEITATSTNLVDYPGSSTTRKPPIAIEGEDLIIESKLMEVNVAYRIYYQDEELLIRKLPDGKIEILEVI